MMPARSAVAGTHGSLDPQTGRHALVVVGTMLVVVPFILPLVGVPDAPVPGVAWALVALSAVANVGVMFYHWTKPAHPKFLVVPFRKLVLRIHIVSGTVELLLGLAAIGTGRPELAVAMALVALLFHVPSALQQTTIVFGSRAIMRPAYLACIALHAFAAIQLLRFPSSTLWLLSTFLVFNVYVWVRVYYFSFMLTRLFGDAKYSAAVLAAGLTTIPIMLGPSAILVMSAAVMVHYLLYRALVLEPTAEAVEDFVRERARDVAVNADVLALYRRDEAEDDDLAAEAYFTMLDHNGSGSLDAAKLRRALADWDVPESLVQNLMARRALPDRIDRAAFRAHFWSLGRVREKARQYAGIAGARSDQDRAALVFRRVDLDGDGYLTRFELEALLIEWGLPASDVDRWLRIADADGDGRITRADFYEKLEPVWRFVYYVVVEGRDAGHDSLSRKVIGEEQDARQAREIRATLDTGGLAGMALFSGADATFLDDVASAMAEERYQAGDVLFSEGDHGRTFYLIRDGRVLLTSRGERLAELGAAACFGEGALLSDSARNATATIVEDVVLLTITRDTFRFLLERHPAMRAQLDQLDRDRRHSAESRALITSLLASVPLFEGVADLERLAASAERRSVAAGAVLLREGSAGDEVLVVVSGAVRIVRGGDLVAELQEGALVGEGALLTGEPRSADVVASRPTTVLLFTRDALLSDASIAARLSETRVDRQRLERRRLLTEQRLRHVSALSAVPESRIEDMVDALVPVVAQDGQILFKYGDQGDRLYLVQRGLIRLEREGTTIATVGPGGCFGELALIADSTRSASAVSDGVSELLALDKERYRAFAGVHPEASV